MYLDTKGHKLFRALVAKALYLSLDRADIQQAVHVLTRVMNNPQRKHMAALKQLGRYLLGVLRVVQTLEWRGKEREVAEEGAKLKKG